LHGARAEALAPSATAYGTLFVGSSAAEVFGDYGAGPNHVLPTMSGARFGAGLSVLTFVNARTFVEAKQGVDPSFVEEVALLAQIEGLDAHRRAALARRVPAAIDARGES
jgi:phosphoribosyl-ATP pyrophosphohydrolase/phosphoribosyl-AMP cyclohydrolase/histidinol dehydrogenase